MAAASRSSRGAGATRGSRRRPQGKTHSARGAAGIPMDVNEVLAAIQSLYIDCLRPFGRILRKRLAERAAAAGRGAVDIDMDGLRVTCSSCPWLRVEDTEGGDWAALFTCYPETFVDIYSPEDVYPQELWQAAAEYFDSLDDEHMVLPGGRYSCAQELIGRRLAFLSGYSLGQVSHMVQLAISQKKLLGYLNGAVVPYARSGSMVKDQCAASQQPCASAPRSSGALVEWEHLRRCLKELMERVPLNGSMPLSNIKRLFRSRFHMELSETALGHSKLSELLNDPQLQDVCFVKLQGHGYVVVHPPQQRGRRICLSSSLTPHGDDVCEEGTLHVTFADCDEACRPSAAEEQEATHSEPLRLYKIRNTFIHVDEELAAQTPTVKKVPTRSKTAPVTIGSDAEEDDDEHQAGEDATCNESCSTGTSPEAGFPVGVSDETLCSWQANSFGMAASPAVELTAQAGKKDARLVAVQATEKSTEPMFLMTVMPEDSSSSAPSGNTGKPFLPSEAVASPASPRNGSSSRCPALTPRMFVVQNTFIHIKPDPDTPWMSAVRKAKTTTHASSAAESVGFGI